MRVLWIAILVAGAAGVACQQSPVVPIIATPPIELNIRVSDSVLVFGMVDTIRVVIKNTLTDLARISFATQCQDRVFISSEAGNVVLPATGKYVCAPVASQLSVPANDSVVRTYLWTGGQNFLPPDPDNKLPSGRYFVSADLQGINYSVTAFPVAIRLTTTR
jgi:hypothetical protein